MSATIQTELPQRQTVPGDHDAKRTATITALTRLYQLYTRLPYIPPECLMMPPETGWATINEAALRYRRKSEAVIDLLRCLPYLKQNDRPQSWTLAWSTLHINYAEGELYDSWLEHDILPLPDHVIWLTNQFDRGGYYWLLDCQSWDLIEFQLCGGSEEYSYPQYEAPPPHLKWTTQTRMPAARYFDLWRHKFETLSFLILPDPTQLRGTAECFAKDPLYLWDETCWPSDEEGDPGEYDPEAADDSEHSSMDEDDEPDLEDDEEDWELLEDTNELEWLQKDRTENPFSKFGQMHGEGEPGPDVDMLAGCHKSVLWLNGHPGQEITKPPSYGAWNRKGDVERREEVKEIIGIFTRRGWPVSPPSTLTVAASRPVLQFGADVLDVSGFDRAHCLADLARFMHDRHARQRAAMERQRKEADDMASLQVRSIRHQLQRMLLLDGPPSDAQMSQVSALLDKLAKLEKLDARHIMESKMHKLFRAVLQRRDLVARDPYGLCAKMQMFLTEWHWMFAYDV